MTVDSMSSTKTKLPTKRYDADLTHTPLWPAAGFGGGQAVGEIRETKCSSYPKFPWNPFIVRALTQTCPFSNTL